jgi:hypothetical protein
LKTDGNNTKTVEKLKTNGKIKKPITAAPKNIIVKKEEREKSANKTPKSPNGKSFEISKTKEKKKEEVKKTDTLTVKKSNNNMSIAKESVAVKKTEEKTEKKEVKKEKIETKKENKPATKVDKKEGNIN